MQKRHGRPLRQTNIGAPGGGKQPFGISVFGSEVFMNSSPRLGGFKDLKDLGHVSVVFPEGTTYSPARFLHVIAEGKINLPYVTCLLLSIFPHRKNPDNETLFGPFRFGAYRTPADWKLAQEGKEQLYKEVVASYQEKRPKVYGLEYQERQVFLRIELDSRFMGQVGASLKAFAGLGLHMTFLAKGPSPGGEREKWVVCLPASEVHSYPEVITRVASEAVVESPTSVATFSMNGPHFGDRYGIASELLQAFEKHHVDLLALNCTIASIIGVVPSHLMEAALHAIEECFEVPSIMRQDP